MLTLPVNKQKGAMWAVDFKLLGSMWRKQCSEFKTAFSASACIPWWLRRNLYYTLWPASLPTKIQARIMCPHLPDLWTSCQIFAAVFVLWLFASAELWQLTPENCLKSWKKQNNQNAPTPSTLFIGFSKLCPLFSTPLEKTADTADTSKRTQRLWAWAMFFVVFLFSYVCSNFPTNDKNETKHWQTKYHEDMGSAWFL